MEKKLKIIVNGTEKHIKSDTVSDYINELGLKRNSLVIELNGSIIKPEFWSDQSLKENDKIEILSFVGGG